MTTDDTTRSTDRPGPALHEPAAPEPGATAVAPFAPVGPPAPVTGRGVRMRTLVFGLVLLAISVTTTIRLLTDVDLDNGIVLLVLLLVAGALLLGGGVLGAAREARSSRN
jgi:hypothetical protein